MALQPMNFSGKWVLVSGASSGLGQAMARKLALEHQANIIAVARRKTQLEELKFELESQSSVQVHIIDADLSRMEEVDRVLQEALSEREVYAAILNAGVTHFGAHSELNWDQFQKMLDLNVNSIVRITQPLVDYLAKKSNPKDRGGLMFVSSMGGLIPVPYQAAYSGTKAFLVNFGCALSEEIRDQKISVTVYAPGGIQTEMTQTAQFKPLERWLMPVEAAAEEALEAFRSRKPVHVPGIGNRVGAFFAGILPRHWILSWVGGIYRGALEQEKNR